MTFPVVYFPGASADIDSAISWLADRSTLAAADFVRVIHRAELHLSRTPFIYQIVRHDIRRVHLKPFRYGLYYRVADDRVNVLACQHTSRSPRTIFGIVSDRL